MLTQNLIYYLFLTLTLRDSRWSHDSGGDLDYVLEVFTDPLGS